MQRGATISQGDKQKGNKKRRASGFSLFELLAVMAIIAILVAVSVPGLRFFSKKMKIFGTASNIASRFRLARQMAITYRAFYGIDVDAVLDQVALYDLGSDGNFGGTGEAQDRETGQRFMLPATVDITDVSGNTVGYGFVFKPDGRPKQGRSVHIMMRGELVDKDTGSYNPEPFDPTASTDYNSSSTAYYKEREKCYTVVVNNITGYPKLYRYGRNTPWSSGYIE